MKTQEFINKANELADFRYNEMSKHVDYSGLINKVTNQEAYTIAKNLPKTFVSNGIECESTANYSRSIASMHYSNRFYLLKENGRSYISRKKAEQILEQN